MHFKHLVLGHIVMMRSTLIVCVALLICNHRYCDGSSRWMHDASFDDKLPNLFTPNWVTGNVKFPGACVLACQKQPGCQGAFFDGVTQQCKMTSSVFLRSVSDKAAAGHRYYRATPVTCPPGEGYLLYEPGATCILNVETAVNWTTARDACSARNGRLLVLNTRDKLHFFMNYLNNELTTSTMQYYLGGTRPYTAWFTDYPNGQPDLQWLTGELLDWTYYHAVAYAASSEPNGPRTESVALLKKPSASSAWRIDDNRDDFLRSYFCEFSLY